MADLEHEDDKFSIQNPANDAVVADAIPPKSF
jgi:hypothetical protein